MRLGSVMPECHKLQTELRVMCSVFGLSVKMDCSIKTPYAYLDLRGMFSSGIFGSDVKIICPGMLRVELFKSCRDHVSSCV